MNTRKEKIQFLKGVLKKENKVSDLFPVKWERFINSSDQPDKYYRSESKDEFYTREQINEYEKKYPWKNILLIDIIPSDKTHKKVNESGDISLNFDKPGQ